MNFSIKKPNMPLKNYLAGILFSSLSIFCGYGIAPFAGDIFQIRSRSLFENIIGWIVAISLFIGFQHLEDKITLGQRRQVRIPGLLLGLLSFFIFMLVSKNSGGR